MIARYDNGPALREEFQAALTDAGLQASSRHGLKGASIPHELKLWKVLGRVLRRPQARRDDLVAVLTNAAYRVALGSGFTGSFLELQLDLWHTFCQAIHESPAASKYFHREGSAEKGSCLLLD